MISTMPDTDTRLSWQRKIGGLPPPAVPPGQPRNGKGVRVDTAADGGMPAQDLAAPSRDCGFGSSIANGGASAGRVSDELGLAMLVEDSVVVPPRESAQPGSSRVQGPSLRGRLEVSDDRGLPWNAAGRWADCIQCGPGCVDPTHGLDELRPPYALFRNELDDDPDLERPHGLDSAGERGLDRRSAPWSARLTLMIPLAGHSFPLKPQSAGARRGDKGKNKARAAARPDDFKDASLGGSHHWFEIREIMIFASVRC
jgi:hypothetical protein